MRTILSIPSNNYLGILTAFLFIGMYHSVSAQADTRDLILGHWKTHDNNAIIEIYKEGEKYYGKIAELSEATDESLIGEMILSDFTFSRKKYKEGMLYDPYNDLYYRSKLWLKNETTLKVRNYCCVLYETFTWEKVQP